MTEFYLTSILISILTAIMLFLQIQQLTFSAGLTLGALLGGLIGAILTGLIAMIRDDRENKRKTHKDKIKIYGRLKGKKILLSQLFESTAECYLYIETDRALSRDNPELRKSFERFHIDLAKARKGLWIEIGLAEVLFNDHNIKDLADAIEYSEKISKHLWIIWRKMYI